MQQQKLVKWLKLLVILAALCGLFLCIGVLPLVGRRMAAAYPEFAQCYLPWLLFLWVLAVPCFIALILAWRIFTNIEKDRSFCEENADCLQRVSYLAAGDAAVLVFGNVLFLLIGMNHPSVLLASLLASFLAIGISVAAAVLSHLVHKAALLQEQSDLTI